MEKNSEKSVLIKIDIKVKPLQRIPAGVKREDVFIFVIRERQSLAFYPFVLRDPCVLRFSV